ncbi:type I-E CRISPR-associated protein Cas7/Cse4/CasC [Microvirga aerophila]|uniref:Type I-E CRISPR-associated protein Cas7/Cse4/CasC n=1 Tax=Microvirga aerophila TaxID=670291 RepID=A0A512C1U2_9HYPH|nr:type I-E CRISPR-associated protein Cas7/Cse4/CasC [Microvirga aerophila]GEO18007.1 type I-E CRISPR-associated protein Cas7/Cse4/CasC [Microvirga aerophila]
MTQARFIQIHSLQSYPAALLNRDDAGLAKRLPYGNATRTRISSQCLKRHWRTAEDEWALKAIGPAMAVRSRETPEARILPALEGVGTEETRKAAIDALAIYLYGKNAAKDRSSRQALLLGEPEIAYLIEKARRAAAEPDPKAAAGMIETIFKKEEKANLSAMLAAKGTLQAGLEAALFGRMVTSDPAANTDAAIHVAHAFTVHAEQAETDYFTVVDDLSEGSGAGGIFDTEVTAGLFYSYVVVDVPLLVNNVGDDAKLAGRIVEHLVHLVATVSPGAKRGSTAPYAYADLMLIETGSRQPRSLANAFREAVRPATVSAATEALAAHMGRLTAAYGAHEERRALQLDMQIGLPGTPSPLDLDALARWAGDAAAGEGRG